MQPRHPANDPVTCGFAQERFELYLDGALQGPDLYALQRHLRDCDRCADFVAEDVAAADALLIALAPLAESAPATVRDGRPITHHSGEIIFVRRRPLVWALGLTAAAGLVVAFSLVPVAFDPGVSPSSALAAQDPVSPDELLGYSPAGAASDHASTSSSVAVSPVDLEPRISDDAQLEGAALLVGRHGEGWPYRSVSVLDEYMSEVIELLHASGSIDVPRLESLLTNLRADAYVVVPLIEAEFAVDSGVAVDHRCGLVRLLGELDTDESLTLVEHIVETDRSALVRQAALQVLDEVLGRSNAASFLDLARREASPHNRIFATGCAARRGSTEAVADLVSQFSDPLWSEHRARIVEALADFETPTATVTAFLAQVVYTARANESLVLRHAIVGLGKSGGPRALEGLRTAAARVNLGHSLRRLAEELLARLQVH